VLRSKRTAAPINLNASLRASPRLTTANRTFFFPSVSGSYILSEDLGLADGNFLNFIKLKASYGLVGRDAPVYSYKLTYGAPAWSDGYTNGVTFPFNGLPGFGAGLNFLATWRKIVHLTPKRLSARFLSLGHSICPCKHCGL